MCYANLEDMKCRFGAQELICSSDRGAGVPLDTALDVGTETYDRIQCALADACAFLNQKLGCCFDICELKEACDSGKNFQMLKLWQVNIARYYLHDVVTRSGTDKNETEQYRRYKEACEAIESFCDPKCCTALIAEDGTKIQKMCKAKFAVAKRPESCIPDLCCDKCGDKGCCCYSQREEH